MDQGRLQVIRDIEKRLVPAEPFQDVQASAAFNAACDEAGRRRLRTV